MKHFAYTLFVLFAVYLVCSQAFLFDKNKDKDKPKGPCNPNPCKHSGNCTVGKANVTTCTCPEGYYGKICENKNGCLNKPCKNKGVCHILDAKNQQNYTCKCPAGFVGKKCESADQCAKSPCKNGKCMLDAKSKAVCECKNGWSGSKCEKRNCTIVEFKGKHFEHSKQKIYVDPAFEKQLHDLDALAKICKAKIRVLKSFTISLDNKTNIYDINTAPFLAGCAIEFEVLDEKDNLLCNSICLSKLPIPQQPAKCLMDGLTALKLKHSIQYPVIHTGCHLTMNDYNKQKELHQVGCREKKF